MNILNNIINFILNAFYTLGYWAVFQYGWIWITVALAIGFIIFLIKQYK